MLGDEIETALISVGITKGRIKKLLGKGCGCSERQERLNELGLWAVGSGSL